MIRRAACKTVRGAPRADLRASQGVAPGSVRGLKVLKDAGLVIDRPAGNRRIYQLDPDGVGQLRAFLDQFWNRALAAFEAGLSATDGRRNDNASRRYRRALVDRR
jgi:DNA-binding transcriptional ArsR family regulator